MSYISIALIGLVLGVATSFVAARRSVKQPVSFNKDCECEFTALILNDPSVFLKIMELKSSDFAFKTYQDTFTKIQTTMYALNYDYSKVDPSNIDNEIIKFREIIEKDESFKKEFNELAEKVLQDNPEVYEKYKLVQTLPQLEENILDKGLTILDLAYDRTLYNGASKIVESTKNSEIPLERAYCKPSLTRNIISGLYGGLTLVLSFVLAQNSPYGESASFFVFLGFGLLAYFTLLWALVDIDTMYLDMYSFGFGFIAIASTALAAGIATGSLSLLLPGVVIAVGGAIIFEIANILYKLLRGRDGIGAGDTLILLASAGAPAALLSSWVIGYYSILFAFILGLIGWVTLFTLGKVSRSTPFAFGPYLAFGWILATMFYLYTQGFTL
jgi:prepilin signal peptidase PulO-like enzyme (type II secretory pathway)